MRCMFYGRKAGWVKFGSVRLCAGLNELTDSQWSEIVTEPAVIRWLKSDDLVITSNDSSVVVEPNPVSPKDDLLKLDNKPTDKPWIPTKAQLVGLTGVGKVGAEEILKGMPVGGFSSPSQVLKLDDSIDAKELTKIYGV